MPPSVTVSGTPVATTNLYQLLSRTAAAAKNSKPSGYVLFKPVKVKSTTGTGKNKKTKTTIVWVKKAGPTETLHRDKSTGNAGLLDASGGKVPKGDKVLPVPQNTVVITCSSQSATVCPESTTGFLPPPGSTDVLPVQARPVPE